MAAGHRFIQRIEYALDADAGRVHRCQEHGRATLAGACHHDAELRADRAGDQPLAAVDHPLVADAACRGREHVGVGARAAIGLGHQERRADLARGQRLEEALLLFVRGDLVQQVHVALVGRHAVHGHRAEQRVARGAQHRRGLAMIEAVAAPFLGHLRREQARGPGGGAQFAHQLGARAVWRQPGIGLEGDDDLADETLGARLEVDLTLRASEIGHSGNAVLGPGRGASIVARRPRRTGRSFPSEVARGRVEQDRGQEDEQRYDDELQGKHGTTPCEFVQCILRYGGAAFKGRKMLTSCQEVRSRAVAGPARRLSTSARDEFYAFCAFCPFYGCFRDF